ncbi:von Willebrand factor type A domain-containing protein [uncultured Polaribacter sp.]|uniref:YfbK domain-containing protein n=1 Tax=uncultured Polaribacter sp. TaxID=174711 RepID=UPI0026196610|nr:von Willebrand factor type A domain-containing protein [uncultured Polaribacter sp.]
MKSLLFFSLICNLFFLNAQEKEITGTVSSASESLPGVSILVKGTTTGTTTDFDGKYKIKANIGDQLIFTYLGYKKVVKTIGNSAIINVVMAEDDSVLEEIVVVGYGISRKSYTTGAISLFKSKKQTNPLHAQISNTLKGTLSGLKSRNQHQKNIRIKGVSTNRKKPLYIVDGVPISNTYSSLAEKLDVKNIEKINIYKSQKAKKLFGISAKNGCIVITTKKGNYRVENDESYAQIHENKFKHVHLNPFSTFSIDVDKASYSNVRRMINNGEKVPFDAVKIEEMVNYFNYNYAQPKDHHPFAIHTEVAQTPWNTQTKLVKIGIQGKKHLKENLPAANLTFLIDVSGSMGSSNKLPLLKSAFKLLVKQLRKKDKVAIVVYAGAAGIVLKPTSGNHKEKIMAALNHLESGGSTAGGAGIELAYDLATKHFKKNGNNRVILATDGDFNVGASGNKAMEKLITSKRKTGIFLSVLGFGYGNYKDKELETLADKGNGNYAYIDTMQEAQKVFGQEFGGTLYTIAKDVKIQLEFNPNKVKGYRLIGYENRLLNNEDFIDDTIDAGELGSGHTVTAIYEIIPINSNSNYLKEVPKLKYNKPNLNNSGELFTVKFRYKKPSEEKSIAITHVQEDKTTIISKDFQFAAAVALFGMQLKNSSYGNKTSLKDVIDLAIKGRGKDEDGYRAEFIRLVKSYENEI